MATTPDPQLPPELLPVVVLERLQTKHFRSLVVSSASSSSSSRASSRGEGNRPSSADERQQQPQMREESVTDDEDLAQLGADLMQMTSARPEDALAEGQEEQEEAAPESAARDSVHEEEEAAAAAAEETADSLGGGQERGGRTVAGDHAPRESRPAPAEPFADTHLQSDSPVGSSFYRK